MKSLVGGFVSIDRRSCLLKCNREVTVYVNIQAEGRVFMGFLSLLCLFEIFVSLNLSGMPVN